MNWIHPEVFPMKSAQNRPFFPVPVILSLQQLAKCLEPKELKVSKNFTTIEYSFTIGAIYTFQDVFFVINNENNLNCIVHIAFDNHCKT